MGPSHGEEAQQAHDAIRDQVLQDEGFRVLRIQNRTMDQHMPSVVDAIYDALRDSPRAW
jgi:very-short-patch-repair endonuclease